MTIRDLRANIVLLQQSAGYDPSKSNKCARGNTSKNGSNFADQDYDAEHTGEFIDTLITSREEGTVENYDNDQDSEANLKSRGSKKCKILTVNTLRVALGDSFFNNIQSCSDMPTNLEEVTCFPFLL